MAQALQQLGYTVGCQDTAERLLDCWARRDFCKIIEYCHTADAFQDIPFSLDYTYQALDSAFPNSKYILTVRDSAEQWFQSLTRFHTMNVKKNRLPTMGDLKEHDYVGKGWLWRTQQLIYGIDANTLYNKDIYTQHYERYNAHVLDYFRYRKDDLLVLNLADGQNWDGLCRFLNKPIPSIAFPHRNRSDNG